MKRLVFVLALLLAAACGSDPTPGPVDGGTALPIPTQPETDSDFDHDALVFGIVEFEEETGCVVIVLEGNRYPVIWPTGATAQRDPFQVVLPDGAVAKEGDRVVGGGSYPTGDGGPDPLDLGVRLECLDGPGRTAWKEAAAFDPYGVVQVERSP